MINGKIYDVKLIFYIITSKLLDRGMTDTLAITFFIAVKINFCYKFKSFIRFINRFFISAIFVSKAAESANRFS